MWTITWLQLWRSHGEVDAIQNKHLSSFKSLFFWGNFLFGTKMIPLHRVRLRSDGAAIPRHRSTTDTHSPTRVTDTPPRAAACPSSPHKVSISKGRIESPEKRRLGTFGSAGSINYSDRKAYPEGHPLRPVPGATRHSSLGDHKSLETEALAEVRFCHQPVTVSIFLLTGFHNLNVWDLRFAGLFSVVLYTIKCTNLLVRLWSSYLSIHTSFNCNSGGCVVENMK